MGCRDLALGLRDTGLRPATSAPAELSVLPVLTEVMGMFTLAATAAALALATAASAFSTATGSRPGRSRRSLCLGNVLVLIDAHLDHLPV